MFYSFYNVLLIVFSFPYNFLLQGGEAAEAPVEAQAPTPLHCTALHCTVVYCTALFFTALYCTALYCTALYCTALCSAVQLYVQFCSSLRLHEPLVLLRVRAYFQVVVTFRKMLKNITKYADDEETRNPKLQNKLLCPLYLLLYLVPSCGDKPRYSQWRREASPGQPRHVFSAVARLYCQGQGLVMVLPNG